MVRVFAVVIVLLKNADISVAPVALFYNLANGFHNAPNFLFHDNTVRRRDNITGFHSGVKVAAKVGSIQAIESLTNANCYRDLYSTFMMASLAL